MYWTLELASKLEDAPWPATKDELIDYAMRSGAPTEVVENLQELEDEQGKSHADDHADNDAQHEAYAVIRFYDFHFFFLFPFKICTNNRS